MFINPCICGSSHLQTHEDDMDVLSPCSTPKRSKKGNNNNNPYSNRGLDKFSALLADVEGMKRKIYTQMGSDEISFVRFAFSNSNDVKPIVVKSKSKKESAIDGDHTIKRRGAAADKKLVIRSKSEVKENKSVSYIFKWENWKKPRYYLPVAIVLILAFLAIYGRAFAIMCTSIGWYVIPTIRESSASSSSSRKQKRKKDHARKLSYRTVSTNISDG